MASIELEAAVSATVPSTDAALRSQAESPIEHFLSIRRHSELLCKPLATEDYALQAMASTSPAKWHLAHTTWFFETFILKPYAPDYSVFHNSFEYLFNSYYNAVGGQYPRHQRGLLSRPTVEEIYRYRRHVNEAMATLLADVPSSAAGEILSRTQLGCHHEQQHQELFFTDLKYCWFQNPLLPTYSEVTPSPAPPVEPMGWQSHSGDVREVGHKGQGFCFDNELPRHKQYVADFRIADRLVTNGEYLSFMAEGGYQCAELWLADGWTTIGAGQCDPAPLYWQQRDGQWFEYTLHGLIELDPNRPVCHLSAYEADAYARWKGCRLPTEFEWEVAAMATQANESVNAAEPAQLAHPLSTATTNTLWQWTSSAYSPYPGFRAAEGAIGEYNGKFMANQLVLRGGSVVTSPGHYRHSYRNFFYPPDQWQFTGVRLAQDP